MSELLAIPELYVGLVGVFEIELDLGQSQPRPGLVVQDVVLLAEGVNAETSAQYVVVTVLQIGERRFERACVRDVVDATFSALLLNPEERDPATQLATEEHRLVQSNESFLSLSESVDHLGNPCVGGIVLLVDRLRFRQESLDLLRRRVDHLREQQCLLRERIRRLPKFLIPYRVGLRLVLIVGLSELVRAFDPDVDERDK